MQDIKKLEALRNLTTRIENKNKPRKKCNSQVYGFDCSNNLPSSFAETLVPLMNSFQHKEIAEVVRLGIKKVTNVIRQALGWNYYEMVL